MLSYNSSPGAKRIVAARYCGCNATASLTAVGPRFLRNFFAFFLLSHPTCYPSSFRVDFGVETEPVQCGRAGLSLEVTNRKAAALTISSDDRRPRELFSDLWARHRRSRTTKDGREAHGRELGIMARSGNESTKSALFESAS